MIRDTQATESKTEYKEYSVLIEEMFVGGKKKRCIIVKVLNPDTNKYNMFENVVPKGSILGKEVDKIIKTVKKIKPMKHIVTQEDIDNNKFGSEVQVGHEIDIPSEEKVLEESKEDTLPTEEVE